MLGEFVYIVQSNGIGVWYLNCHFDFCISCLHKFEAPDLKLSC